MRRVFAVIPYLKGTLFFIPILLLCCQSYAYAAAANLQWDPSSEPSWLVGGYIVYYKTGSPGEPYGTSIDVGNVTEYTLTGLDDDEPYFISVAVYTVDDTPIESNYSNEVAVLPITSPQDGFYVNASNYTSYMVEGKASPNADDIIVKSGSDKIGGPFEDDDGDGNWSGACDFSSTTEGAVSLTAESDELNGITSDPVVGTYDKTPPSTPVFTTDVDTSSGIAYSINETDSITYITLSGSYDVEETDAILVNGSSATLTPDGTWTYTGTVPSDNSFVIIAVDAASNESVASSITFDNFKPYTPVLSLPEDGATDIALTPELQTGDFSDPDADDTHAQTQWQISSVENDFSASYLLLDMKSDSFLTSLELKELFLSVLTVNTTYWWRVRFYDDSGDASEWSDAYRFTTTALDDADQDGDGIPDDQEVDSTVDLDGDGTADINQSDMKCVNTVAGNAQVCIKGGTNVVSIESLESSDPDTISDNTNRPETIPFGLITFKLTVSNPGDTANVILYSSVVTEYTEEDLEAFIETGKWYYKYDSINGWQNYSDHATLSEDRDSIILELRDQGYGDADGTANAIIVDPSGLGTEPTTPTGGGGDGGGCFIATVAFGSNMDRHVQILSQFRDKRLANNYRGQRFIAMYNRFSPPVADYLRCHPPARAAVRYGLIPITGIAYMALYVHPVALLFGFILLVLTGVYYVRRSQSSV